MSFRGRLAAFSLFIALTCSTCWSQSSGLPSPRQFARQTEAVKRGREWVKQFKEKNGIPGLSIAVMIDGRVVWSEGFGYANLECQTPASPQTQYRIGSVTKLFTATAAARLFEDGQLDLDAPVQKYVPQFPEKDSPITIRQLAGHLGGVRHYRGNEFFNTTRYPNLTEALKRFKDDPLLHEPGSKYAYSSFGYVLLGAALEGASQKSFTEILQEKVFAPLGMRATAADFPENIILNRSGFYSRSRDNTIQNGPATDISDRLPAGGYLSSAEDLARFGSIVAL